MPALFTSDVDAAERSATDALDARAHGRVVGDVDGDGEVGVRRGIRMQVEDGDRRAALAQALGDRGADARGAAGDDRRRGP